MLQSPVEAPDAEPQPVTRPPKLASIGWALRRVALWLAIIAVLVAFGAWLFYASIDVDEASAAGTPSATESPAGSR
jgi:hypothetical protein